jgi:hypothetical protein
MFQNGTTKHCLQKRLCQSELSIPITTAILDSSKIFQEAAAVTAKQVQIGNRPCRIYGEAHTEYLLLQMTGEHELQSMDHEVTVIAQSSWNFLFAAIPVESWNDALSPWEAPAVWGTQGFGGKAADTLSFLTEQVIPTLKQRKTSKSFWAAIRWRDCLRCGHPPRLICFMVSPPPRPLFGFRTGWSLNSSA